MTNYEHTKTNRVMKLVYTCVLTYFYTRTNVLRITLKHDKGQTEVNSCMFYYDVTV